MKDTSLTTGQTPHLIPALKKLAYKQASTDRDFLKIKKAIKRLRQDFSKINLHTMKPTSCHTQAWLEIMLCIDSNCHDTWDSPRIKVIENVPSKFIDLPPSQTIWREILNLVNFARWNYSHNNLPYIHNNAVQPREIGYGKEVSWYCQI